MCSIANLVKISWFCPCDRIYEFEISHMCILMKTTEKVKSPFRAVLFLWRSHSRYYLALCSSLLKEHDANIKKSYLSWTSNYFHTIAVVYQPPEVNVSTYDLPRNSDCTESIYESVNRYLLKRMGYSVSYYILTGIFVWISNMQVHLVAPSTKFSWYKRNLEKVIQSLFLFMWKQLDFCQ